MGAVFSIFAGFYYWAPKMFGKMYEEHLAQAHFWTFFIGVNMTLIIGISVNFNTFIYGYRPTIPTHSMDHHY